jgi:hypothetical protein
VLLLSSEAETRILSVNQGAIVSLLRVLQTFGTRDEKVTLAAASALVTYAGVVVVDRDFS